MATVLLSAAGSAIGGSFSGTFLGLSGAVLGRAVGGIAGSFIDHAILGTGSAPVEVGRARSLRLQSSTEGAPIARVYGRMRVAGQVFWATRFHESVTTTRQGGKATGGQPAQKVNEFSYSVSFAVGLCEGVIDRVGRVWADGKLIDLTGINHRVYPGDEGQLPDPKIEAVEGAGTVPAYRGLAYIVFEDIAVGAFGNRIPQLTFEVFRRVGSGWVGDEAGTPLPDLVEAVCLSPGTGEFALDPAPSRMVYPAGGGRYANINNASGVPDVVAALDQLESDLPGCGAVSLVVSWFGTDLRCGRCQVQPRIEAAGRTNSPEPWSVAGLTNATAPLVSADNEGRPNFGGTPSDGSVIRAIQELAGRGKKVMLYPFLLMDVPGGNGLGDPYGGTEQAAFPWRGRLTLDLAPGLPGSADQSAIAGADVAAFFGTASAVDFAVSPGAVSYSGPVEWTWRRFILHMAALAAAAGGAEAICIGSELRGLTTIRSAKAVFPAVAEMKALAAEVRTLLPGAKITYAADWSEYFGYQPQDGSGDVLFHLDPLWADANIDAIGIDDYTPLSDWRHVGGHADEAAGSVYSLPYLSGGVEGGEYFDWYYSSEPDRAAQARTPIVDAAHGEHWIFRPKDIRGWWSNAHHNRVDGIRQPQPTAWVPGSKPIWLTETGCPAVDLGANQPNVFLDDKSSESALPYGSRGARDDEMQRRFLQAKLGYWAEPANNPTGSYGGPMIPTDRVFVWTWDARPWPDFPVRESLWSDGPAHRRGHWMTGRVTSGALADVVAAICLGWGMSPGDFDVSRLYGVVDGYLLDETVSGREALQPLMQAFAFDAFESGGVLVFVGRQGAPVAALAEEGMIAGARLERQKAKAVARIDAVRLGYVQAENDYRVGSAEARLPGGAQIGVAETSMQLALPGSRAQSIADRWLSEALRAQETAEFAVPLSMMTLEPGDVVTLDGPGQTETYRIDRITDRGPREVEAVRAETGLYLPNPAAERSLEPALVRPPGPLEVVVMELPLADGGADDHRPRLAVAGDPWGGEVAVMKSADGEGYTHAATVRAPAAIGQSETLLQAGAPGRWQRVSWEVTLPTGSASSALETTVLNGANTLAVEIAAGQWEILQFRNAELIGTDRYRLTTLLRGLRGTDVLSTGSVLPGARVVLLNDSVVTLPIEPHEVGLERYWKIGPAAFDLSHPSYVARTWTAAGAGLRPFAPAHLRAHAQGGDLAISWIRTTRVGGERLEGVEVPLAEEHERYRVTVRQGGATLRTEEVDGAGFVYSAAMQVADGAAGAIEIGVARLSATHGYGPERVVDANV